MKNFLILLTLVIFASGCGAKSPDLSKLTSEQQLKEIMRAIPKMKSAEMVIAMDFQVAYDGESEVVEIDSLVKYEIEKDLKMEMTIELMMQEVRAEVQVFVSDRYVYVDGFDSKFKMAYPEELKAALDEKGLFELGWALFVKRLNFDQFGNLTSVFEDGCYVLTYDMKEETLKRMDSYFEEFNETELQYNFKNGRIKMKADKNAQLVNMTIEFDMVMRDDINVVEMDFDIEMNINHVNKTKVVLPEDLNTYRESDIQ